MNDDIENISAGTKLIMIKNSVMLIEQYLKIMNGSYETCSIIGAEIVYIRGLLFEIEAQLEDDMDDQDKDSP